MHDEPRDALSDAALDREISTALGVDPSPDFVARMRMRIASEPAPARWHWSWRAPLWACVAGGVAAAAIYAAVVVNRGAARVPTRAPLTASRLAPMGSLPAPYVGSAFRRTEGSRAAAGPAEAFALRAPEIIIDPRERAALQNLVADVRTGRVDLTPLLQPPAPEPMDLPPITDIVIAPITIEPIAPIEGAQGVRQ